MSAVHAGPATPSTARSLLPPEAYWSTEWFERERDWLFGRSWVMVGTLDDLAGGRRLVANVAGWTVWVERGEDGCLSAQRLTGDAVADVWAGYVFVHLDPRCAPTLGEWLGDFPQNIGGYRPDLLVEVARHRFTLAANWKLFVENHVDVYHLWHLHGESLGAYDHRRSEWSMCGPHWVFYEPPRTEVDIHDEGFWRGLRPISHVAADRWGSGAHLIFPNLTLATGAGFFMTYQCIPVGPERSVVDLRVRAVAGSDPTAMLDMSRTVIEREDGAACEAMQAAVRSPWFGVGPLASEHELPITRFHEQILFRLPI